MGDIAKRFSSVSREKALFFGKIDAGMSVAKIANLQLSVDSLKFQAASSKIGYSLKTLAMIRKLHKLQSRNWFGRRI
ncbi:MAG: hypothetical protein GC179_18035 [Anaerolineaceae bacterium]|nr:hypothetical protein [Anaerolineaceae bacterium]